MAPARATALGTAKDSSWAKDSDWAMEMETAKGPASVAGLVMAEDQSLKRDRLQRT
jgi:hypothetical protein